MFGASAILVLYMLLSSFLYVSVSTFSFFGKLSGEIEIEMCIS